MPLVALLLVGLINLGSPIGLIEQMAQGLIQDRFESADVLTIQIEPAPNLQLLQGKVNQIQVVGQGLVPFPEFRIARLSVDTAPVDLDMGRLKSGKLAFDESVQAELQLGLELNDLNHFLQSSTLFNALHGIGHFLPGPQMIRTDHYDVINPQLTFLKSQRLEFQAILADHVTAEQLTLRFESGLTITAEGSLQLVDPIFMADGVDMPPLLSHELTHRINNRLARLETLGLSLRPERLTISPEVVDMTLVVEIDPISNFLYL